MTRFRTQGTAWDGQKWFLVPAGRVLAAQIEAADPERSLVDGTVASKNHDLNSPTSDHSPDADGAVRAIDWGGAADLLEQQFQALCASRDERLKYVIHNGRLFSNYPRAGYDPFTIRPYSGSSPHKRHIHASISENGDELVQPFDLGGEPVTTEPISINDLEPVENLTDDEGEPFVDTWKWFLSTGVGSEHSDPTDPVETQQFATFLKRYHSKVIVPQIQELKRMISDIQVTPATEVDIEAIAAQLKLASTEIVAVLDG